MKQKGIWAMVIALLSMFLMIAGCRDKSYGLRELEYLNRDAVVVVKCISEKERSRYNATQFVHFRVAEVWLDESNGTFTNKVGDYIQSILWPDSDVPTTLEGAVLFVKVNDSGLRSFRSSFIYNGKVFDMPVEQARHILSERRIFE